MCIMGILWACWGNACLVLIVPVVALCVFNSGPTVVHSARLRTCPKYEYSASLLSALFTKFLENGQRIHVMISFFQSCPP